MSALCPYLWLDGSIAVAAEARLDPRDRGFLLGDGLFETLLARSGRPLALADHLLRLRESAAFLDIPLPFDAGEIAAVLPLLLDANQLRQGSAAIRITLSRGAGGRGLLPPRDMRPRLLIEASPYKEPDLPSLIAMSVPLRRNETSPLSRLKSLSYLDHMLAQQMAHDLAGAPAEALQRNGAGRVVGFARGNLFALIDDRLLTPPVADGVLPGIARRGLLHVAGIAGLAAGEHSLMPEDLLAARALYLTNSLLGLQPILRLDNRTLAPAREEKALAAAYAAWLDAPAPITL